MKCYDWKQHKTTSRKTKTKEHLETKKSKHNKKKKQEPERENEKQEGRKKDDNKTETKKEKGKKGGCPKKAKEKQRETLKINKKCLFLGGKQVFCLLKKTKKGKQRKKQNQKKTKEYGGFRAKWGGPLGHLTWPLNPPKKNKTTKKNPKKKQKNKEGLGPSETALWATSPDP